MTQFCSISRFQATRFLQISIFSLALLFSFVEKANSQTVYALSGNQLVWFNAATPGVLLGNAIVSGIASGQDIAGLDFRPNTGQLYALGYHQSSGEARLYTLDLKTFMASAIGAGPITLKPNMGKIGMDFNPTVDRIRITGSNGSNYRLHPVTGALAATDMNLAFAATDANASATPSIGTVAYTNSYIGATSTTLYNYDDALNILTTQIPPNNGTLNTVGASGFSVNPTDPSTDLDIWFDPVTGSNKAYLAANTGGGLDDHLFTINLTTGATTSIGKIGAGIPVRDIAVFIDRSVPKLVGALAYALTSTGNLISFDVSLPGTVRKIVAITGITAGQVLAGMDFRPATSELFGLGYNALSGEARLYTLDPATGVASPVGAAPFMLKAGMGKISMDFNPTVDRIRVVGSDNSNYRIHPTTGMLAATDLNLTFAAADPNSVVNPSIGAAAYTNSFAGATATALYNYEDSLNILTLQAPPNNGTLNTIGASGIQVNLADPSTDLDILYNPYTNSNMVFLTANTGMSTADNLYQVNLTTGAATLVGKIGNGIAINDLALSLFPVLTACDTKTSDCVKFDLLNIAKDSSGNKVYRIRVTNNCADKLDYVAFQIPNGVLAVGPASSPYASVSGHLYILRNPNYAPFYSVRFKDLSTDGIANGQSDVFEYTLPTTANPSYLHVAARTGSTLRETYLNVYNCSVGVVSSSPPPTESNGLVDRKEDILEDKTGILRLYPNPTEGILFADLSAWAGQSVELRTFNAQGQMVFAQTAGGGASQYRLYLPDHLTQGLYFVEVTDANGVTQTKRFILQR